MRIAGQGEVLDDPAKNTKEYLLSRV